MLFIDAQRYCCERNSPQYAHERRGFDREFFFREVTRCKANWARLIRQCRLSDVDIVSTVITSLRPDGKDMSRDYKRTGFFVYASDPKSELVDELRPASSNEICIPKTSSSVFQSTNLDFILRSLGSKTIIIAGLLTDQCVCHAVLDACDLGYKVIVVRDACTTGSETRHANALEAFKGYTDAILSTDGVLERLSRLVPSWREVSLITGFSSFPGVEANPTEECVRLLEKAGARTQVLGVSMEAVDRFVVEELTPLLDHARLKGSTVTLLHLGVAESSIPEFKLERRAYNEASFRIPDTAGQQPQGQPIMEGLSIGSFESTAPLDRIIEVLDSLRGDSNSFQSVISDDPGRYICNYLYFKSLAACAAAGIGTRTLFLHVPAVEHSTIEEQAAIVRAVCHVLCDRGAADEVRLELETIALDDKSIDEKCHAAKIRKSLETVGFFVVRPDFPFEIVLKNARAHKAFFALPLERKKDIALNKAKCGYHTYQSERLDPQRSSCGDLREGVYFRLPNETLHPLSGENQWPASDLPGYRETVEQYMDLLKGLGMRLVRLLSLSLGKAPESLDKYFTDPLVTLRPLRYEGASDEASGRYACGEHSDFGFITLLYADGPGLQICVNGQWRDVPVVSQGFIVNIGDMAEHLFAGAFKSTRHRVVNSTGKERFSMPLFFEPNFYASIPVVTTTSEPAGCPAGQSTGQDNNIVSGEYLLHKYRLTHS